MDQSASAYYTPMYTHGQLARWWGSRSKPWEGLAVRLPWSISVTHQIINTNGSKYFHYWACAHEHQTHTRSDFPVRLSADDASVPADKGLPSRGGCLVFVGVHHHFCFCFSSVCKTNDIDINKSYGEYAAFMSVNFSWFFTYFSAAKFRQSMR